MVNKKELLWFFGTLVTIFITYVFLFDFKEHAISINILDTYIAIPTGYILLTLGVCTFFVVYLLRMFLFKFKSRTVNLIFIVSNITIILFLTQIISWVVSFRDMTLSDPIHSVENDWQKAYIFLLTVQSFLVIGISLISLQTGRLFNKN